MCSDVSRRKCPVYDCNRENEESLSCPVDWVYRGEDFPKTGSQEGTEQLCRGQGGRCGEILFPR